MSHNLAQMISSIARTTGREPAPLVGASTTVLNDTLYVFAGRPLTKQRLTNDLYALDLDTKVWTKIEATGDIPSPRYFHSVCALGDTKLVCYGGMSPLQSNVSSSQTSASGGSGLGGQGPGSGGGGGMGANSPNAGPGQGRQPFNEIIMMSDIHIFDIETSRWTYIPTDNAPEGRYAHCATVLPSWAVYTSSFPQPADPANIEESGEGGAELVIVGGQNALDTYIEEINVFNFRSLRWTSVTPLGKSCGVYKSVVISLPPGIKGDDIGSFRRRNNGTDSEPTSTIAEEAPTSFPQTRRGTDAGIKGNSSPSSTSPTTDPRPSMLIYSNYNFLDVRLELQVRNPDGTLTEKPLSGSFTPPGLRFPNGGVLANHLVVSGTYLTGSVQEYALWALNLSTLTWTRIDAGNTFQSGSWNRGILWPNRNAFIVLGRKDRNLVDDYNQRKINFTHICTVQLDAFGLFKPPPSHSGITHGGGGTGAGGLPHQLSQRAHQLGKFMAANQSFSDMVLLSLTGDRVPVSSRILSQRWGPYFDHLLTLPATSPAHPNPSSLPDPSQPPTRPRTLFLPHTQPTLIALVHYLYTNDLPSTTSPQILCSLLQLARPYRVPGLLGKVVERLHGMFDAKNAAAVFNAAAMAAGPGDELGGFRMDDDGEVRSDSGEVLGLQKRGLRGLAEGRWARERGRSMGGAVGGGR
ncbi:hypothetical protein BJ508DRAFT_417708 [Ascobolus immersus RN42]|uniref:Galactose oxidase n=1 Tax=Ascobolus immersus RN42 TaxID=1160509 RepID=A0A3N4HQU1_ASCIM|nr:hypothetical protein BJ508DRAFT_417708 [Ascobolus immersus RN42]